MKLLVVEDNASFRRLIGDVLSAISPEVFECSDGVHVLNAYEVHRPDVVLMDIAMPVMDGIEATRAIRDEVPGTRIVVVTGSAATDDVSRARSAGASGYVTKDQIAGDLVRAILDAAAA